MLPTKVVVVGCGGMGRETVWIIRTCIEVMPSSPLELVGFVTSEAALHDQEVCGLPVLGPEDLLTDLPDVRAVCAIGDPRKRRSVVKRLQAQGVKFATIVHPSVACSKYVSIGEGSIIASHVSLTTQVRVGQHVIVNVNASVSHDSILGAFATLAPGVRIPGHVAVGDGVELGVNSCVLPGLSLGKGALIGAGAVVTRNVEPDTVVAGVPARVLRKLPLEEHW